MGTIKLSILIPTVVGRNTQWGILEKKIHNQLYSIFPAGRMGGFLTTSNLSNSLRIQKQNIGDVEIWLALDNKEITIGAKRQRLYELAKGEYSWQIDDDDDIHPEAIQMILAAIDKEAPDCITFREKCIINGQYKSSNHSIKYPKWADNQDGYDYVRSPFYKDVIKTEIAQKVPFPDIRWNEDEQWSYALLPHLKTEVHIDEELYIYQYESRESHNERYGIK